MGGQAKSKKKTKDKSKDKRSNKDSGFAFLSPQERLKLKMQEKTKKKTAEKYSVEQLLEKTEECMDSFDFEMAGRFCQRALELEPNNQKTLDMLGHIHSELGDTERAKTVFLRAVELSPDKGHSKYMYLGQLHTGQEAVNYYTRGIQIILAALERQMLSMTEAGAAVTPDQDPEHLCRKDVCVAYCSVAEIYLTDLCMEDGAGDKCREAIESALQHHHDNPEALQIMASYLFSTEKNQEGRDYLIRSVGAWLPSLKRSDALPPSGDMEEDPTQREIPPYETRITTAKLLMESEEYETHLSPLEPLYLNEKNIRVKGEESNSNESWISLAADSRSLFLSSFTVCPVMLEIIVCVSCFCHSLL